MLARKHWRWCFGIKEMISVTWDMILVSSIVAALASICPSGAIAPNVLASTSVNTSLGCIFLYFLYLSQFVFVSIQLACLSCFNSAANTTRPTSRLCITYNNTISLNWAKCTTNACQHQLRLTQKNFNLKLPMICCTGYFHKWLLLKIKSLK